MYLALPTCTIQVADLRITGDDSCISHCRPAQSKLPTCVPRALIHVSRIADLRVPVADLYSPDASRLSWWNLQCHADGDIVGSIDLVGVEFDDLLVADPVSEQFPGDIP